MPAAVGLAVIDLSSTGDGIAYVARLLQRALTEMSAAPPRVIELGASTGRVPLVKRTAFTARLWHAQVSGGLDWLLFNHIGIARAQLAVPARYRLPYAVMLYGIDAWDPRLSGDRRRALRGAALRIAISRHTAERVADAHPDIGPVHACPLGALPEGPANGAVDRVLLERVPQSSVLITGRMSAAERYKGHDQLLECWPAVLRQVPDARLVVAGRGDDSDRLQRKADTLGIGHSVIFAGFVSDATLVALYEKVGAFAMPSRGEGFGLVYLDAMRAGLPCIGSTADAAGDIIVAGETGFLVDALDTTALAAHVVRLLNDPGLARRLGAAGRLRFERVYRYEQYRDRLAGVLQPVFGRHSAEVLPCVG